MLQGGGGDNVSSAILREFFSREVKSRGESSARKGRGTHSTPRCPTTTGILPIITPVTDLMSLKQSRRRRVTTPRRPPRKVNAFELPHHGIGLHAEGLATVDRQELSIPVSSVPKLPSHGKAPPFNRRSVVKEFFDSVSTSGSIACLSIESSYSSQTSPRTVPYLSPRV